MKHELGEQWIEDGHMYKAVRKIGTQYEKKDLGPVNGDGCLAEERTGLFPEHVIEKHLNGKYLYKFYVFAFGVNVTTYGETMQEAKDAWNRRA